MKIEFFEQDNELKAVIAVINGNVRKILPLSKTVEDLLKMPGIQVIQEEKTGVAVIVETEAKLPPESPVEVAPQKELPPGSIIYQDPLEIQREDLVRVVTIVKGLSDQGGNELAPRTGVVSGGIYRVLKVNKTIVAMPDPNSPDGEAKMTSILNSIEAIDDKAPRPERIVLMPNEVVLHKKRDKAHSVVKQVFSANLKCAECGDMNAFVLDGSTYKGTCQKCGTKNQIERLVELCSNEKCLDQSKKRTQISLFLYGEIYSGQCGTCKTTMEKNRGALV